MTLQPRTEALLAIHRAEAIVMLLMYLDIKEEYKVSIDELLANLVQADAWVRLIERRKEII